MSENFVVMSKSRLEAFSDGVIAIIITIMVLEMEIPEGASLQALSKVLPLFLTYIFSFIMVGIYWNNHHHLFQAVHKVNGKILWANLALLFWLSLFPFATGWMGRNHFEKYPVALYGAVLFIASIAYAVLVRSIMKMEGKDAAFSKAVKKDQKGMISSAIYVLGIGLAFYYPPGSVILYVIVALIWLIPDQRMEKALRMARERS